MALSIKINITDLRLSSIPVNTKVADIVASGGTEPYTYSLASGDELFQINGTTVVTKAVVTLDNIIPFSVTVTDSTSASATSDSYYPSMQAAMQYRFSQANYVYKITKDIDLGLLYLFLYLVPYFYFLLFCANISKMFQYYK